MQKMKIGILIILAGFWPLKYSQAQIAVAEVIKAGVTKAIRAVDLKIQRLQNNTIWLQNAQKTLENALSKIRLEEIANWTGLQEEQYSNYFQELAQVKGIVSSYRRIKNITEKQWQLMNEYSRTWTLIRRDQHFTTGELDYMEKVYTGILEESLANMNRIALILRSFTTSMSDAKRLELINDAADRVDVNYTDLADFNRQNILLSLQKAKTEREIQVMKQLYGIE